MGAERSSTPVPLPLAQCLALFLPPVPIPTPSHAQPHHLHSLVEVTVRKDDKGRLPAQLQGDFLHITQGTAAGNRGLGLVSGGLEHRGLQMVDEASPECAGLQRVNQTHLLPTAHPSYHWAHSHSGQACPFRLTGGLLCSTLSSS